MAIFDPTNTFSSKESSNNNLESDALLLKIIKPVYCFSLSKIHFYGSFSSPAESSSSSPYCLNRGSLKYYHHNENRFYKYCDVYHRYEIIIIISVIIAVINFTIITITIIATTVLIIININMAIIIIIKSSSRSLSS